MSGFSKVGHLAKWLHLCFIFALGLNRGIWAQPLLCSQWKQFDFSVSSLVPALPSACNGPVSLLFITPINTSWSLPTEKAAPCTERRQQEQRGVLNKTSAGLSLMGRQYAQKSHSSSLSVFLMGSWMPGKWACPDWPGSSSSPATGMITLIILFSSRVNTNSTIRAFCQHRVNKGSFSCTSPSFLFLSGDSMPSGIVGGGEIRGSGRYQRGLSCSWSREKSWLPVSGVTWLEARGPHRMS